MANQDIMCKWIQVHFRDPDADGTAPSRMLIMDSFSAHLTERVKRACAEKQITQAVIPGGMTGLLQPLDLTVNRSFKCKLKEFYHRNQGLYVTEHHRFSTKSAFNLHLFTLACKSAWAQVSGDTIRNGFAVMHRNARVGMMAG